MLKSANKAATTAIISWFALALSANVALAFEQQKYDKRIEAAVMEIVAKKIGNIRGTVEADAWVAAHGVDNMVTGPVPTTTAAATPPVQLSSLTPTVPSYGVLSRSRPVRRISSFLQF
ncbi:MAG: hypothetical protein ACRCU5_12275 [Rhizobiaceae bacterium]